MGQPRYDPIAGTAPITPSFPACRADPGSSRILVHMFIIYFYRLQTQTAGWRGVVMTKLILVRHGMPDEGHLLRPHDPPLNRTGENQAAQIAERLAGEGVGRIVSSPQTRAQNTAAPLAQTLGLAVETMEGLAEVDRYTDRYRSPETIRKENPGRWEEFQQSPARFFGGDDGEFRRGVLQAFATIMAEPRQPTIAVFTHGMPIKTLLLHVLGLTTAVRFTIGHCSVTRAIGESIDTLRIESVNETLISHRAP
jgi:broad specificity phosphatase PhoE